MPTPSRSARWFAAARRPRMLGLLLVLLLAAGVCGRLGAWQLDRAAERSEQAAARAAEARADTVPVPVDDVVAPQTAFTQDAVGRRVEVSGRYLGDLDQYLVAESGPEGGDGLLLLAPFRVEEGQGAGAIMPVVRGWLPGEAGDWTHELEPPGSLAVPSGRVTLVGILSPGEAARDAPGADRSLGSVSAGQLVNLWGSPIYAGYLRATAGEPPDNPVLVPAPPAAPAGGPALQNLAYAAQWWIFGAFALAIWLRLVRDEAERLRE